MKALIPLMPHGSRTATDKAVSNTAPAVLAAQD